MRHIVLVIFIVIGATGGFARPLDDDSPEQYSMEQDSMEQHSLEQDSMENTRYGAPTLRAMIKSTAFPRNPKQQRRRHVRSAQGQDTEEVREAFALYDLDGDGAISDKEFELYDSNDEYETADHDVDGDGTLDLQEFASWYDGPLEEEEMRDVFRHIDQDASGFVSASELLQWFTHEGLHEEAQFIKVIVRGYDADGDDVLDQEEFGTFMNDEDEEDAIDRYLFTVMDGDGDKSIAEGEYAAFSASYGMELSEAELKEEMDEFDADGNGAWSLPEFLRSLNDPPSGEEESLLEFEAWDGDGDGLVSEAELNDLLTNIGAFELAGVAKELMKEMDGNDDGKIDFDEFISVENMI